MKFYLFLLIIILSCSAGYSQQFTSADILATGHFSVGVNPVLLDKASVQSGMYLHGGMGLNKTMDLSLKLGFLEGSNYYGGDIEWLVRDRGKLSLSMYAGAHVKYFFGLDAGFTAVMPLSKKLHFYTGIDTDLIFGSDINHNTWLPVGLSGSLRDNLSLILELDVPMSEWAWNILGGGIIFYL
ncbi:MAG: hypothetical protein K9H49_15220 [Bacteroidales bacterium]|nr:hypothetical protein [Bacteroidales bacterium]MCF8391589.1 hypothetical protein [Bacteroidales bacterium]